MIPSCRQLLYYSLNLCVCQIQIQIIHKNPRTLNKRKAHNQQKKRYEHQERHFCASHRACRRGYEEQKQELQTKRPPQKLNTGASSEESEFNHGVFGPSLAQIETFLYPSIISSKTGWIKICSEPQSNLPQRLKNIQLNCPTSPKLVCG